MADTKRKLTVDTQIIITELRQARSGGVPDWLKDLLARTADHLVLLDEKLRAAKQDAEHLQAEIEAFRDSAIDNDPFMDEMTKHREI